MTPEGSIHISQAICFIGLLPFLLLGLVLMLGCLRALWYFVNWLRTQSLSTRWLTVTLPLVPVLVMLIGTWVERKPDNITTCGLTFTILSGISVATVFFISGALHAYAVLEKLTHTIRQTACWQKVLLAGILLDLVISSAFRG